MPKPNKSETADTIPIMDAVTDPNPAALAQAELDRLRQENSVLRDEVKRLKRIIGGTRVL